MFGSAEEGVMSMWRSEQHSDDENLRWTLLRAVEWREWPLFLSQPIIPISLCLYPWTSVIFALTFTTFLWWLIVAPRVTPTTIIGLGIYFFWLKLFTAPLAAYWVWREGGEWAAIVILFSPLLVTWGVHFLLMIPRETLQTLFPSLKAGQIGLIQRRLMSNLGYDRIEEVGYKRRDVATDELNAWLANSGEHGITPIAFQKLYLDELNVDYGPKAQELMELLVCAGIGVGKYKRGYPSRFWRRASVAANQLHIWLKQNPLATAEARSAQARQVVSRNRLISRSLRGI
jgi:hypothetical protein